MKENIYAGTPEWKQWMAEVQRTGKLHVADFASTEVVLDEENTVKGVMILKREVEAMEEVGNKARPGQVLYWYGDHTQPELPKGDQALNVYDVQRNVYAVDSQQGELVRQDELDDNRASAIQKLVEAAGDTAKSASA